jgi:hypothetical protein
MEEFGVLFEWEVRHSAAHQADNPPALDAHRIRPPASDPRQLNASMHDPPRRGAARRLSIDYACARRAI